MQARNNWKGFKEWFKNSARARAEAAYAIAKKHREKKEYDQALEYYNQAIQFFKQDTLLALGGTYHYLFERCYHERGQVYYAQKKFDEAIKDYDRAIDLHPEAVYYMDRGKAYQAQNNLDAAIKSHEEAIRYAPWKSNLHYHLGMAHQAKGNLDAAIKSYEEAIEKSIKRKAKKEKQALYYSQLGDAYKTKGKLDEAKETLLESIRLNPKNAEYYNKLGMIYVMKNELDLAEENIKKALELNPEDSDYYNNFGVICKLRNELDEAIKKYQQAIAHDSSNASYFFNLALAYQTKSELDLAKENLQTAIQLSPNKAKYYSALAEVYKNKGDLEAAKENFAKAVALNPTSTEYLRNHGITAYEVKAYDEAIKDFTQCITLTNHPFYYFCRGLTLSRQAELDFQAAQEFLQVATSLDEALQDQVAKEYVKQSHQLYSKASQNKHQAQSDYKQAMLLNIKALEKFLIHTQRKLIINDIIDNLDQYELTLEQVEFLIGAYEKMKPEGVEISITTPSNVEPSAPPCEDDSPVVSNDDFSAQGASIIFDNSLTPVPPPVLDLSYLQLEVREEEQKAQLAEGQLEKNAYLALNAERKKPSTMANVFSFFTSTKPDEIEMLPLAKTDEEAERTQALLSQAPAVPTEKPNIVSSMFSWVKQAAQPSSQTNNAAKKKTPVLVSH